jgi:dihydrofolate reductase
MLKLISIAAIGRNNELGKDNDLLWHLPDDFKRFKKMTTGHYIIMGRKTFESFPKPLPNRTHVVITRQENYPSQDCIVVKNLDEAINTVKHQKVAFVIGGGEIYKQFMPLVDELELTEVEGEFEADTYFPDVDENLWDLIKEEHHPKDDKHKFAFTYKTYQRKDRS